MCRQSSVVWRNHTTNHHPVIKQNDSAEPATFDKIREIQRNSLREQAAKTNPDCWKSLKQIHKNTIRLFSWCVNTWQRIEFSLCNTQRRKPKWNIYLFEGFCQKYALTKKPSMNDRQTQFAKQIVMLMNCFSVWLIYVRCFPVSPRKTRADNERSKQVICTTRCKTRPAEHVVVICQ